MFHEGGRAVSRPGAKRHFLLVKLMLASNWQWRLNGRQSGYLARYGPYGSGQWKKLTCVPTQRFGIKAKPTRRRQDSRMVIRSSRHCSRIPNTEHLAQSLAQLAHASKRPFAKLGALAGASDVRQRSRRPFCLIKRASVTPVTGMGVALGSSHSQGETGIFSYSI